MNTFLLDFQPKPLASTSKVQQIENDDSDGTETCEFCKKSFEPKKILKHIGNSKDCKSYYGSKFAELKTAKISDRNQKYKKNLTVKEMEKTNKVRREKYGNDPERQAKMKMNYQDQKGIKLKKTQDNIALASKGLNCNGKENEPEDDDVEEWEMQCEFCRKKFDLNIILRHIARND